MKNLTLLCLSLMIITTGCEQTPPPTPSPNPTPQSTMTAWETSLVGQWKLKRSEMRGNSYQQGLGDSTFSYTNHYNYNNSLLELTSVPYTSPGGTQLYEGKLGNTDIGQAYELGWHGANNQIFTTIAGNYTVHYLSFSPDSLVLDNGGQRFFYNKSNTPPTINNIESQLIGGTWTLVSSNGNPSTTPTYKTFFSNWNNVLGYFSKDSIYYSTSSNTVSSMPWEVLFPNRTIPILYSGQYSKITNLTANALTLELMGNPQVNSSTMTTYIYSR